MAITTKKVLKWIWSEFWREMKIQRAPAIVKRHYEPIPKKHRPGDALKGVLLLIIAPVIFVILAGFIGL